MEFDMNNQVRLQGLTGDFKESQFPLDKEEFFIGRLPKNDMVIDEETISSQHAKIIKEGDQFEIYDLGSTNGTFVNGKKIDKSPLRTDDKIKFDIFEFQFINPFDVPKTVLSESVDPDEIKKTMVRPLPQAALDQEATLQLPTPDVTMRMPTEGATIPIPNREAKTPTPTGEETIRLPVRDITPPPPPLPTQEETIRLPAQEQPVQTPPPPPKPQAATQPEQPVREAVQPEQPAPQMYPPAAPKKGNIYVGVVLGVLAALLIGYIGVMLGIWSAANFSTANMQRLPTTSIAIFPLYHLHTPWLQAQFSFSTIIILLGMLAGLILGGALTQRFARGSRLKSALFFSIFYVLSIFAAQLAVMEFRFALFTRSYYSAGLGIQQTLLNIPVTVIYIFLVCLIFSFIGSFLSKRSH